MSELTPCNFCSLQGIQRQNPGTLHKVSAGGWIDIYIVPKGETLNTRTDPKTGNHLSKQWKASMMEITNRCVC